MGRELITFPKPLGLKERKAKGLQWETDIISKGEHVSRWQEPNRQSYMALEALLAVGCPLLMGEVPQASPEPPGASKTLLPLGFAPGSPYHPVPLASLPLGFQSLLACLSCGCLVRTEAFISPTPTGEKWANPDSERATNQPLAVLHNLKCIAKSWIWR